MKTGPANPDTMIGGLLNVYLFRNLSRAQLKSFESDCFHSMRMWILSVYILQLCCPGLALVRMVLTKHHRAYCDKVPQSFSDWTVWHKNVGFLNTLCRLYNAYIVWDLSVATNFAIWEWHDKIKGCAGNG